MKLRKITLLGLGCVLSLAVTAGAVTASTGTSPDIRPNHKGGGEAIAQIFGMDSQSLGQELKSGNTLAQIAADQGMDTKALKQELESTLNERLDKAVAEGKLTADKEVQIKAQGVDKFDAKINQPWTGQKGKRGFNDDMGQHSFNKGMNNQTLQSVLGLDVDQLKEQLKGGKSLEQIAADKGISKDDLTAKFQAAMEANIDQAIKDQKMTADQATQMKAKLPERIDRMITQTHIHQPHVEK